MSRASMRPGWTLNFKLESGYIKEELIPPSSIGELIEAPSTTMKTSFAYGYPSRDDALATLNQWLQFAIRDADLFRKIHERDGNVGSELREYLDRRDRYLEAVRQLIDEA